MIFELVREGAIANLTINRPERMNALPREAWPELIEKLEEIASDQEIRAIVLSGRGRCFSVGGDVQDMRDLDDLGARRRFLAEAVEAVRALEELPKPVVAAVHGACLGGGLELTLVADVVIAGEGAVFGAPESRVGLVPGVLIARGPSRIEGRWLRYLAMTGESVDAERAREAGLVHEVIADGDLLSRATEMAVGLSERAPLSLELIKEATRDGRGRPYSDAVEWGATLQSTEDFAEGVAAFKERRQPVFRGR